jgi:hypothetical protein
VPKVFCDLGGHWFDATWADRPLRFFNTEHNLGVTCPHCYLLAAIAGTTLEQREKKSMPQTQTPFIERAPANVLNPLTPDQYELLSVVNLLAAVLRKQGISLQALETSADTGITAINTPAGKVAFLYSGMPFQEALRRVHGTCEQEKQP